MKQNKPKSKLNKKKQDSASVVTSEMGARITALSKTVGGKRELAGIAGLSESQLHRIVSGRSQAKIENIAAMAVETGVSLDWLATGKTGNGIVHLEDHRPDSDAARESQRLLQEEQRQTQQEKFKKGLQLVFDMSKDNPDCNPESVWSALLIELLAMHGLQESGYQRIQETLKKLKERDEGKHRNS